MSDNNIEPGSEPAPHNTLLAPLRRVRGVLIVSIILCLCIMFLGLPLWFRAPLIIVILVGTVWAAAVAEDEEAASKPVKKEPRNEMAGVTGERLADMLSDP